MGGGGLSFYVITWLEMCLFLVALFEVNASGLSLQDVYG